MFSVLGIQIDSPEDPQKLLENEDLLLFAINTMVEEMIPKTNRMTPIVLNRSQVTILFNEQESESEFTERITSTIKKSVNELTKS